jgi:malonyl-CoA/methylmalonyl-CoA synthetase
MNPDRGSDLLSRFWSQRSLRILDVSGEASHEELLSGARAIAHELLGRSNHLRGERVGIFTAPGRSFVQALFGILDAGGVAVVLSPLHPEAETEYFLMDAGVHRVLVDDHSRPICGRRAIHVPSLVHAGSPHALLPTLHADRPALQLYTSGTTARPKGAVLSHGNISLQQQLVGDAWGFQEGDVLLHTLPLHHMHGLCIALLTAIGKGASVCMQRFSANEVWDALKAATVFMGVPTMYAKLFEAYDRADAATKASWQEHARALRLATSGSAALPVPIAERWAALTGTIPLERFGMTEIGVGISNPLDGERIAGTVGFPLPSVEIRIVDEQGAAANEGALLIRGPSVFLGYHVREASDASARATDTSSHAGTSSDQGTSLAEGTSIADVRDADGWFHTGDTVARDADGRVRILGRSSVDILKSGGYKLSALEIEDALRRLPGVEDAAVVGLADPIWGQRVVGCVIVSQHRDAPIRSTETIRAALAPLLASYKIPKDIVFIEEFPRNPMGKVIKPELIRLLLQRAT